MALRRRRAPTACAEPTTGPHTLATPCPVLQWLVFGGALSPADLHIRAATAWGHHDYAEALRLWSQAVSLQPGNAELHYLRGRAPATLGLRASAADAFQVTLLLEPQSTIAREAMDGLAGLQSTSAGDGEVLVPLESGLGVWIVPALVNGHGGRFLLDTGSSVIVVGPTLVGDAVLREVPVVLHDPGPGVDEILGNTFLSQYLVTSTPIAGNWVSVPSTVMERPPCIRRWGDCAGSCRPGCGASVEP